jgi:hypothetical protein
VPPTEERSGSRKQPRRKPGGGRSSNDYKRKEETSISVISRPPSKRLVESHLFSSFRPSRFHSKAFFRSRGRTQAVESTQPSRRGDVRGQPRGERAPGLSHGRPGSHWPPLSPWAFRRQLGADGPRETLGATFLPHEPAFLHRVSRAIFPVWPNSSGPPFFPLPAESPA